MVTTCEYMIRGKTLCNRVCHDNPENRCHRHKAKAVVDHDRSRDEYNKKNRTFEKLYQYIDAEGKSHVVRYKAYCNAIKRGCVGNGPIPSLNDAFVDSL